MSATDPMAQQPMAAGLMAQAPPPTPGAPPSNAEEAMVNTMDPSTSPEQEAMDDETFETMVAGLKEHLFGAGEKGVSKQLKDSKNIPETIGLITYQYVKMATDQATQAQREFDMDMIMGVATEVIESLFNMADALKLKAPMNDETMAEALLTAVQAYQANAEPNSEEQETAKALLAEMQQNGMVDEGAAALKQIGEKAGVDPFAQAEQAVATQSQPPADPVMQPGLMGAP